MMKMILINDLATRFGLKNIQPQNQFVAKVECSDFFTKKSKSGKLILVTAMTSNKSGVGKTTISIGLADALNLIGKKTLLALREPSMGPVFGIKGGATGGGKSQVVPSDDINLHFTGDFHAISQANNLLVSIVDNHIFQGNQLDIDVNKIFIKRCLDLNDRSLRRISYKIGNETVESGFVITAASEIMAILALSKNLHELKKNLGDILVALTKSGEPVFARDLHAEEAMTILLQKAFMPNIVQTLGGNLALVHLGPFANIAHGCNSVVATKYALSNADFCVTEAGFGSDLGAEKFLDIKCRILGQVPDVVVLVVTLKVVKEQGEGDIDKGFENVKRHIRNCSKVFSLPTIVAINKHKDDDRKEISYLNTLCQKENVKSIICTAFEDGGKGCLNLANSVAEIVKENQKNMGNLFKFAYNLDENIKTKFQNVARKIYGAKDVEFSPVAEQKIFLAEKLGFSKFFVNIAKTQFSFSDEKDILGAPSDFIFHINDVEIRSGAKMIVGIAGSQMLMPGLGKDSNYLHMSVDDSGHIDGIF